MAWQEPSVAQVEHQEFMPAISYPELDECTRKNHREGNKRFDSNFSQRNVEQPVGEDKDVVFAFTKGYRKTVRIGVVAVQETSVPDELAVEPDAIRERATHAHNCLRLLILIDDGESEGASVT
ncbi:MAG: hypothetical protein O3B01_02835 [Planctomycetota bacterium]|nr:hypothetical protein [Planctomycetota bacterium]